MGRTDSVLLGRNEELARLVSLMVSVRDGESAFVIVSGEAGIGKTRLLSELTDLNTSGGYASFSGRASEFEREIPFGTFIDALDAYLASLDAQARERLAADRLGALGSVFPALTTLESHVDYPVSALERFRIHRAVADLLERLAARHAILLTLDDMQWADDASFELLSHLARHPPNGEIMIVAAIRVGAGDRHDNPLIRSMETTPGIHTLELKPLDVEDLTELVGQNAAEIHRLSGGNPLYAISLAASIADAGDVAPTDEGGVPALVASTVAAELTSLPADAQAIAQAAAVAGDPFDISVAAVAADREEDEILDLLDLLLARDIVRQTSVPRKLQFRHPIVRSAVYQTCPPGARIRSHARVADYLTALGATAGEIAHHLEQCARPGDMEAVSVLRRAGKQAGTSAPRTAIRWYEAALRLLPNSHTSERAEMLSALANSLINVGRLEEAYAKLEEGLELTAEDEPRLDLVVACAALERQLGRYEDGRQRLLRTLDSLPHADSQDRMEISVALAQNDFHRGDYRASLAWGQRAGEMAERLSDPVLATVSLATQTMSASMAGEIELGLALHRRAEAMVDALDDSLLATRLDALSSLAGAELYLDLYDRSARHAERCLALSRRFGDTSELPISANTLGTSSWLIGEMQRSGEVLDDAIEAARLIGNPAALSWVLFNRAYGALEAGDVETASRLSEESMRLTSEFDAGLISAYAGAVNAMTLMELGDPENALRRLLDASGGEDLTLMPGSWRPTHFELLTRCYLGVDDLAGAKRAAQTARKEANSFGLPLPTLMADLAEADVALAEKRWDAALELSTSAAEHASEIGAKPYLARAKTLAGEALAMSDREDEATDHFRTVAQLYDEMGAKRYLDKVNSQLRALGRPSYRRTRPGSSPVGMAALTGRESEVAELIRDRRTNREIADALFLSTKTVETHIRNIFNKLGVQSRVDIARALDQDRESITVPPMP